MIGKNINGFHIVKKLGEGGMADVYKAIDLNLEREVAIKFLRIDTKDAARNAKRFEREAKALAKLRHPNIVSVINYGNYDGQPYLVMDYIPGGTLKAQLGKPIPWNKAAFILAPIARALHYAHSKNIIHRDVKPSNILISESGEPMLSDFGVAKMLGSEETLDLTGTSVGIGTPYYMSPEQGRNKEIGPKSDIYSLGVVFYEMITGSKPFEAETPMAVILKHIEEPLPSPSKTRSGVSRVADNIVFTALAKDPKDRYKSMHDMAAAFEKAGSGKVTLSLPRWLARGGVGVTIVAVSLLLLVRFAPVIEEYRQTSGNVVSSGEDPESSLAPAHTSTDPEGYVGRWTLDTTSNPIRALDQVYFRIDENNRLVLRWTQNGTLKEVNNPHISQGGYIFIDLDGGNTFQFTLDDEGVLYLDYKHVYQYGSAISVTYIATYKR